MNASEARAQRQRLGYKTLVEREMLDPDFRAGVEAEEGVIARELHAREFARLVAREMIELHAEESLAKQNPVWIFRFVHWVFKGKLDHDRDRDRDRVAR